MQKPNNDKHSKTVKKSGLERKKQNVNVYATLAIFCHAQTTSVLISSAVGNKKKCNITVEITPKTFPLTLSYQCEAVPDYQIDDISIKALNQKADLLQ